MESCTLLVLGSQYGLQIYDWNGAVLVHEMDFEQSGVGAEDRQVPHTGPTRGPGKDLVWGNKESKICSFYGCNCEDFHNVAGLYLSIYLHLLVR